MSKRAWRVVVACVGILGGLLSASWQAQAQGVPRLVRGQVAIRSFGSRFPQVAQRHGYTPQRLAALLERDHDLALDAGGNLISTCTFRPPAGAQAVTTTPAPVAALAAPFELHSRPESTHKIYLDFNGHTTTNTFWNVDYVGGAPIVSGPFDSDGNPGSFSASEQAVIQEVWTRVSEDYAPFDVDVTTEDPGQDGLRQTSLNDDEYGVRIVVTQNPSWYPNGGGVAYIGTFRRFTLGEDLPGFVFADRLQKLAHYIGEAAAHEAGHTLGLHHDGVTGVTPYYAGQGSWAPIMGDSYSRPVTQWSKGEYTNASNTEDDLQEIEDHGAPLVDDDYGDTLDDATDFDPSSDSVSGMISSADDADVFRLTVPAGTVRLQAVPSAIGPNLDISLQLYDAAENHVAGTDDPALLSAALTAEVAAGTYYAVVRGSGNGTPEATGYSSYASIGPYTLSAQAAPLQITAPNGGEFWTAGSAQTITWNSTGVSGNVKLELSTNGGVTWTKIIASTPNDGSQPWTVPATLSTDALLRVSTVFGTSISDTSDDTFIIAAPEPAGILKAPTKVSFGTVKLGKTKTVKVTLTNGSKLTPLSIFVGSVAAPFRITAGGGSTLIQPKKKATVTLVYEPVAAEASSGNLTLTTSDPARPTAVVALTGKGR